MSAGVDGNESAPIVLLANGNMNGRVIRLVADALYRTDAGAVDLITTTELQPLNRWPDERTHPYLAQPTVVDLPAAERRVTEASVFVLPPFWNGSARQLVGLARRAGTPVVCIVADVGYGARKLQATDDHEIPDRVCVADPVTRRLIIENGLPASVIRNTGSPYFDSLLKSPPLPPPPSGPPRIGLIATPNGVRERLSHEEPGTPDGVLPAVDRVLRSYPGSRLTVRLHPRQDPARIAEAFPLPESAVFDPWQPASTLPEFIAAHHLVVGSFSMGLMVARLLGRPAVSFQPPMGDDGLRREVFAAWDVPIATDEAGLAVIIAARLQMPVRPLQPSTLLYEPGTSVDAIASAIRDVRARRQQPALRPTILAP